jgi:hypothetical protein
MQEGQSGRLGELGSPDVENEQFITQASATNLNNDADNNLYSRSRPLPGSDRGRDRAWDFRESAPAIAFLASFINHAVSE